MVLPHDTSADARARQLSMFRAMTSQERLRLAAAMSDEVRALARDGLRSRHIVAHLDRHITVRLARLR